jgi:DNA-directed RNA polymerase subunit M/transcription elongation factor TFIIS
MPKSTSKIDCPKCKNKTVKAILITSKATNDFDIKFKKCKTCKYVLTKQDIKEFLDETFENIINL